MRIDWSWLGLHVGLPVIVPIILSLLFVAGWLSLDPSFDPDPKVIIDVTPWALNVYSLTLIGSAFRSFWSAHTQRPALTFSLCGVAAAQVVYYAFLVIRRHDPAFSASEASYYVSGILTLAAVCLCYRAR